MSRLERLCEERGLRMSDQRRIILQVLDAADDHPSVEEVYRRTLARDCAVSIATVYRTINLLAEKGLLARVELGDGTARYEEAEAGRHEHLLDVGSGRVVEFRSQEIAAAIRDAVASLGYRLVDYRLEVFGASGTEASDGEASLPAPAASVRVPRHRTLRHKRRAFIRERRLAAQGA